MTARTPTAAAPTLKLTALKPAKGSKTPLPFKVRNAACAKCDGNLYCYPGGFPFCARGCGKVKLVTAAKPCGRCARLSAVGSVVEGN